jgi:general secretion pathway protein A
MYSHHFGLTQDPFSIAPDPRYLFMSERHREALAHLLYGIAGSGGKAGGSGGGFVLLTGDIGTGKTTICRCFLEQIPEGCHVAYIFNPKLTVTELLQSICEEFHITLTPAAQNPPTVKDHIDGLNNFLLAGHAAGQSSVLIIDEAQNLAPEVLEQLRLLTNLETRERKLLQIVLIGQPDLRTLLARPELEQLAQRVIARFHLDALTAAESAQYIAHRLAVAGLTGPSPFEGSALQRIQRLTRGIPRRINLLCGRALLGAWAHGLHRVDRAVVDKAATEVFGPDNAAESDKRHTRATALIGLLLLAIAAISALYYWPRSQGPVPSRSASASNAAAAAAAAPSAPASSTTALQAQVSARPVEELEALLPQLPRDINAAWHALGSVWKLPPSDGDSCRSAKLQKLQCYRTSNLSLPQLRQLNRPGILTLQVDQAAPVYALLVGLDEQYATLQLVDGLHRVRQVALGRLWQGDFATYWQAPPDYLPDLRDGSSGGAIEHLASQLDLLEARSAPSPGTAPRPRILDAALRERVLTFQRAQGLKADGQPGPMTFMQLDSAAGTNRVRLQTEPR